jgi:hypothetical protein
MTETLDIISVIDKNPITKLSKDYQNKLICKIKQSFTESQQNLFVGGLYCYLNYDCNKDFVVELRKVWNWLGFSRIEHCKVVLVKNFIENVDYTVEVFGSKKSATEVAGAVLTKQNGGQNKEKILMTVSTFKKLCLKSNTKKADEIHGYFVKLEELVFKTLNEETSELRLQIADNSKEMREKMKEKDNAIIDQFPENEMCIYIADIGVVDGEHLIKFGESNNLKQRVSCHRRTFENFELISAHKVVNSKKFENKLKEVVDIKYRTRVKCISGKNTEELIAVDENFTASDLNKIIKNLIEKHCTVETYLADVELRKLEINAEMKKEEEKTKQMQIELEILKLKSTQPMAIPRSSPIKIPTPPLKEDDEDLLEKNIGSKILLLNIIKRYKNSENNICSGYNNYNGYSNEFKKMVESDIKKKFGIEPIKNNGKIYYTNLRFKGHTSFYNLNVYREFIYKHVTVLPDDIKYEKIPPGLFKYKVNYEQLLDMFIDYSGDQDSLYETSCPSGPTTLFKKEFISIVCKICDVKPPSYSNKTIKYFNGIVLK